MSVIFGQLVIGPPGSGKTTYCTEMGKFLESLGRKVAIVNIGMLIIQISTISLLLCYVKITLIFFL